MTENDGPRAARAARHFCRARTVWDWIGVVVSLSIIAAAAVVLYRALNGIEIDDVLAALWATEPRRLGWAAGAVAAGYFTLTFYDLFALRTLGLRAIPYGVAARAGFTSYAIGHSVGAATFTGAAVRYRIYSAYGLNGASVAKVCFLAALTFWLGNVTVLGLGIALEPGAATAIDWLTPATNRILALLVLGGVAFYVAWVWRTPRRLGRGGWTVRLPNGPLTLLQIGIGAVDLTCCAFAMRVLLPSAPAIGFVTAAVVFVTAMLLGFASHSPGGLGVFEATMLFALPQFDKEALLAGLLLFRLLYFVAPLAVSLIVLGTREIAVSFAARGARQSDGP